VRFVVFGAGAIGGVVGARLHQAGHDVTLIARGAHHDAIRHRGLTIEDPDATAVLELDVADAPRAVRWSGEEAVLLAVKSQDSLPALRALQACAPAETPIVCLQNGVENERVALRLFANVYGAVVMAPTAHLEPGIVQAYGTTLTGAIDVGRYPLGTDDVARQVVHALGRSRFESAVREDIMRFKHAKLLMNLGNAVDALCGSGSSSDELTALAQEEGRAVLRAAGVDFVANEVDDVIGRWQRYGVREIAGRPREASSTRQSLMRAAGSVECDYLNGEILLLGRLHGIPTPVNELLQRLIAAAARERAAPGSVPAEELLAALQSDTLRAMRPAWRT
jgi:2-dehydropantoate 2-reductase